MHAIWFGNFPNIAMINTAKKYIKYIFENMKLNNSIFLFCIECRHSCAIVCIRV